eukprot:Skav200338  [mRNA]  locus=scaffold26:74302:77901:+ [translate_table: standard]
MEGGRRISKTQQRKIWIDNLAELRAVNPFVLSSAELPSLVDLELALRRVSCHKATGLDGIPGEMCRFHAPTLAKASYTQLMKLTLHGQESLEHKGGQLCAAYKGRGPQHACSSYRSLLVSSHPGKVLHRALRQTQSAAYSAYMQCQQIGGRPAVSVGLGVHFVRAFHRRARQLRRASGYLFLDLQEAFYRLMRPLCVDEQYDDATIAHIFARLQLPEDSMHALMQQLQGTPAIHRAQLPWHQAKAVTALHKDTWFVFGRQSNTTGDVTRTAIGSRPGDCFADVIFGYAFAAVLRTIEQELHSLDILTCFSDVTVPGLHIPATSATDTFVPFMGPCWMDDLCVCFDAADSHTLERKMMVVASCVVDRCREVGMSPNLAKGKTEALFDFRSTGTRQLRRKYYGPIADQQLHFVCETGPAQIAVVGSYKHLGSVHHHTGSDTCEIRRRSAIAHSTFTEHRRTIFQNPHVSLKVRAQLFQTLVLSRLLYGLESWVFSDRRTLAAFRSSVYKLYRRLLRLRPDNHITDEAVLDLTGLPSPDELLSRSRLRYFGTLFRAGAATHWSLLRSDTEWCQQLRADCRWLWGQLCQASPLQDPDAHLDQWQNLIVHYPGYWKKLINRGIAHACQQRRNLEIVRRFHRHTWEILRSHWALPSAELPLHCASTQAFGCMQCGIACKSAGGEGAHLHKRHGYCNAVRFMIQGTQCPHCLREYYTYSKLQRHFAAVKECRIAVRRQGLARNPAPGIGSQIDMALCHEHDGLAPIVRAHGPAPLPVHAAHEDFDGHCDDLHMRLVDCILAIQEQATWDCLEARIREVIQAQPISWTRCTRTLSFARHAWTVDDLDLLGDRIEYINALLTKLSSPDSWPFLSQQRADDTVCDELWYYEECFAVVSQTADLCRRAAAPSVPAAMGQVRVFLHVYSGRRRKGDLQWYLEKEMEKISHFDLVIVSLDVMVDAQWGDISQKDTQEFWLAGIRSGLVVGMTIGPPCETWSQVRNVAMEGPTAQSRGPRVLREPACPWGKPSLRLREISQLCMGNELLGFGFVAFAELASQGHLAILEHPKEPDNEDYVSVWRVAILRALLALPGVETLTLSQGLYGSESAKPTQLLLANCEDLWQDLHQCRLTSELPVQASVGRDHLGQYRTARLKEYAPAFCWSLAKCLIRALCRFPTTASLEFDPTVVSRCRSMVVKSFGSVIGQDFCR